MRKLAALACSMVAMLLAGCYPPSVVYPDTPFIMKRRATLKDNLIALLPPERRGIPAAQEEAQWLADTAYKAAAGISRVNGSYFPGWAGNALINARLQDRGLCWHYQQDMYRELRRRPLKYFRIGCCVRDKAELSEHNCVYVAAADGEWPECWVLDAWMWNGRLKVDRATDLNLKDWGDLPETVHDFLAIIYKEGHQFPMEHWAVLRSHNGKYECYATDSCRSCAQYSRMYDNIMRGKEEHPGKPTNY